MQHYPILPNGINSSQKRFFRSGIFLKYLDQLQNPYAASQGKFPRVIERKVSGYLSGRMVPDDTPGVVAGASLVSLDQTTCRHMLMTMAALVLL
ncbi:hypothetical protein CEXT_614721 [Caerostris extrusa]|uniref:Uncharacterized protein n=1 Tax=Caerostris extrusa TaxID=172846 RepID=A0AAV4P9V5_CAEEX|nr:hypothetical protein CEXT_614721 [Caerostris extrusa]